MSSVGGDSRNGNASPGHDLLKSVQTIELGVSTRAGDKPKEPDTPTSPPVAASTGGGGGGAVGRVTEEVAVVGRPRAKSQDDTHPKTIKIASPKVAPEPPKPNAVAVGGKAANNVYARQESKVEGKEEDVAEVSQSAGTGYRCRFGCAARARLALAQSAPAHPPPSTPLMLCSTRRR